MEPKDSQRITVVIFKFLATEHESVVSRRLLVLQGRKAKLAEVRGPTGMKAVQCKVHTALAQHAKKPRKSGGAGLLQVGD